MKRVVLTYGLLSGIVCALVMIATLPLENRLGFDRAEWLGYTVLVLDFLLVFFGIRAARRQAGGHITFPKAFAVGFAISLFTCLFYVATWEVMYFVFMPDFMDRYAAYVLEKARASGASPAALAAKTAEMARFKAKYNDPLYNAAVTFLEPFPVGLAMTLLSAALLRKKNPASSGPAAPASPEMAIRG